MCLEQEGPGAAQGVRSRGVKDGQAAQPAERTRAGLKSHRLHFNSDNAASHMVAFLNMFAANKMNMLQSVYLIKCSLRVLLDEIQMRAGRLSECPKFFLIYLFFCCFAVSFSTFDILSRHKYPQ